MEFAAFGLNNFMLPQHLDIIEIYWENLPLSNQSRDSQLKQPKIGDRERTTVNFENSLHTHR
ncbi:hypothetical protein [Spirulina sp. 06S082]|uniref:hypothetical protein n=1 Tax=Spirulina sp. 06S082 TaxID=3110248 RepID=UPI002B1EC50C|nr:hypothetical protein [Spirulina sp. 06S082]MEA5470648.1 hypothetical protein [Spirulina sp. 06S082]